MPATALVAIAANLKVAMDVAATSGRLHVSLRQTGLDAAKAGLGTGIVNALAAKLQAQVCLSDNDPGTIVTVVHAGATDSSRAFDTEQTAV